MLDHEFDIRNRHFEAELKRVRGALSRIATRDSDAVRRFPSDPEDGLPLFGPDSPDQDRWVDPYMSAWERDEGELAGSKSGRRLGNKSQVITLPPNSHIRDREDHCSSSAGEIVRPARILGLNAVLARVGMRFHDMGHVPGGHPGEEFISLRKGWDGKGHPKFKHNVMGVILAQSIERGGQGLNLTRQVLDIILNHSSGVGKALVSSEMMPETALAVKIDKIDYTFADFNDIFKREPLADQGFTLRRYRHIAEAIGWFGRKQRERVFTCIAAMCVESAEKGFISFDDSEVAQRFEDLKALMYRDVYLKIDRRMLLMKMEMVYEALEKCLKDVDPALVFAMLDDIEHEALAAMIDRHEPITERTLSRFSVGEVIKHLRGKQIDLTDPDLGWAEVPVRRDKPTKKRHRGPIVHG